MSNGRKKKETAEFAGPNVVTLDQNEFNEVCKRVHTMLMSRVERAKARKDRQPTDRASQSHIEASKEVFVFVHLLELVENMTEEISDLRSIISQVAGDEEERPRNPTRSVPEMFTTSKKRFLN